MKDFFKNTFLFSSVSDEDYRNFMKKIKGQTVFYHHKDEVFSPLSNEKKIAFVVKGKCSVVRKHEDGSCVLLNQLKKGDSFGLLSLFSDDKTYPTTVIANGETTVIFLEEKDVDILLSNPQIAKNMLSFVVKKALFLNSKIAELTEKDVSSKLWLYIKNKQDLQGSNSFPIRLSDISRALNCGRASVYRALRNLEDSSMIQYQNNQITILQN